MARSKKNENKVNVGNISGISGNLNIAGGDITTHQTVTGLNSAEIKDLFTELYLLIEERANTSSAMKEDLNAEVKEIQTEISQAAEMNQKVDETFLSRHFRNIARMAPDVLDVIVATLANPLAGLGIAVKKIAEKAREEVS